jgi:hypothetical protein
LPPIRIARLAAARIALLHHYRVAGSAAICEADKAAIIFAMLPNCLIIVLLSFFISALPRKRIAVSMDWRIAGKLGLPDCRLEGLSICRGKRL